MQQLQVRADAPAVQVQGLRKVYGSKVVVDDVSFEVAPGEVFGVLGPNGAGKTTTLEAIAGLRIGDGGRIQVHGIDPWSDRTATTRLVGVQLQHSQLQPKITVREALELWSAFYDAPRPWGELAERLGLGTQLDRRFGQLSGGQQQRLSIALALVGGPRVAILDELTTGLDPRARRDVWQLVRELQERGVTVLLVTHAMEEAHALCDRLAIIDGGRIRALDSPDGLIAATTRATVTSFEPSASVDLRALATRAHVTSVRSDGDRIIVEGPEGAATEVLDWLRDREVTAHRLRVVDATLDTAYLALTATAMAGFPEPESGSA